MSSASETAAVPTIAVVICTRDRPRALLQTLDTLWRQTRRPNELIIIDDGRLRENVLDELSARCREFGLAWRYERTDAPGLTRARNRAARLATSDTLLYLDDDVSCDAALIEQIARIMQDPLVTGVTAVIGEPRFTTPSARLYQWGYRLAGWWRVHPRRTPPGPAPVMLDRPDVAVRARWLSGAAMALRREVVLRERFDEELTAHALGEDREMGYRLAPRYWLLEARQARVVHRREGTSRADPRALGFMTGFNTLRILERTCRLGAGDWLIIGWGFAVLGMMHLIWALGPSRRAHLAELRGMIGGVVAALRARRQFRRTQPQQGRIAHAGTGAVGLIGGRRVMRVLFVTNRLEPGGAERMLASLVARLPRHDVLPHIACLKDAGPLARRCRELGIPVFGGLLRFKVDVAVLARLGRILSQQRIDVVVAAHSGGDRMFWSTLAGRMFGAKVVVWSHWFPAPNERHLERANRALIRCVDAYVALGRRHRSALVRHEGVPPGRITVIPNAVNCDMFRGTLPRAEARRRLGLGDHDLAIAIIANLRSEKRHDVFIRAARLLAGRLPEARFLVIGDGPQRRAVHAAVEACGLDSEVLRMLGARDDVADLLPGLDVCCLCSERECFSVTMLEAAAAGCAFIGPDCGSIPEFVEHRHTGLLIRPADVRSLTDALEALATDADLRRRLAAAAQERVFREYGIDRTARAFANLFQSLRPGRSPRRSA